MWSLKHQLPRTCRWLLDQYFDDCTPWAYAHKALDVGDINAMDDDPQPHDLSPGQLSDDDDEDDAGMNWVPGSPQFAPYSSDGISEWDGNTLEVNLDDGFHRLAQPEPSSQTHDDQPPSPKRCKLAHFDQGDIVGLQASRIVWPRARIPVEIFDIITSFLGRAEIKTLRLVCREFDLKVSASYFRNVVVPFRSELYNALSPDETGARPNPSTTLLSNGMRIFESFGPYIQRFALSLEMDEDALAYPPVKPDQEAIPTFWGVYRWPHASYNRYTDLERIEETADETQTMKEALKHLDNVRNLGLCCDAGLGFLVRADPIARRYASQTSVFSSQDRGHERHQLWDDETEGPIVTVADFNGRGRMGCKRPRSWVEFKRAVLEQMVAAAGFTYPQADEAIDILLATEKTDMDRLDLDQRPAAPHSSDSIAIRNTDQPEEAFMQAFLEHFNHAATESSTSSKPLCEETTPPLQPNDLTRAQRELLLELDWAHRAMIQSYVIAMADNGHNGHFSRLTTLTIAKIPSSHVPMLCRKDFWHAFPGLSNVSLGVIADWRRVAKPAPGMVDDYSVSPLEAVEKIYQLLNSFIGQQPQIESLHFEWICGGELAPSFYQRNQYILPAPFLEQPADMASPLGAFKRTHRLLSLPHIKNLSLKNCWASPHVMLQMIRQMGLSSLQKLELEAVSLCGAPTFENQQPLLPAFGPPHLLNPGGWNPQAHPPAQQQAAPNPGPLTLQDAEEAFQQAAAAAAAGDVLAPAQATEPAPTAPLDDDKLSDPFCWAGFLRHFFPEPIFNASGQDDEALKDSRDKWKKALEDTGQFIPDNIRLLQEENSYSLRSLSLKSCGYVAIDSGTLRTRSLFPPGSNYMTTAAPGTALKSVQQYMQKCYDKLMGRIIPYISPSETTILADMFHMTTGWEGVYGERIIQQARLDGIEFPGLGRISGTLGSTRGSNRG